MGCASSVSADAGSLLHGKGMSSLPELAAQLGLNSPANDDLSWLVARCSKALAGKPSPVKTWDAVKFYSDLAISAQTPDWAENAEEAEPVIRNGWFRAISAAAFEAQAPEELSVEQEELLLVCSDEPAPRGWVTAVREAETSEKGLVPASYIVAADVAVVAATAFVGSGEGELSFVEGDEIIVRPGVLPCQAWWLARVAGKRGYVPRYLLDPSWRVRGRLAVSVIWGRYAARRDRRNVAKMAGIVASSRAVTQVAKILRGRVARRRLEQMQAESSASGRSGFEREALHAFQMEEVQDRLRKRGRERKCAAALGIDLESDPDLVWVARRALQSKHKWTDASIGRGFWAMAAAAVDPVWPDDLLETEPLLTNGWYRATSIAAFQAQDETELSLDAYEPVYVRADTYGSDAWCCAARSQNVAISGLVPRSHVVAEDCVVKPLVAWAGLGDGDLSLTPGDKLLVRPGALRAKGYMLARRGRVRGLVPRWLVDVAFQQEAHRTATLIASCYRAYCGRGKHPDRRPTKLALEGAPDVERASSPRTESGTSRVALARQSTGSNGSTRPPPPDFDAGSTAHSKRMEKRGATSQPPPGRPLSRPSSRQMLILLPPASPDPPAGDQGQTEEAGDGASQEGWSDVESNGGAASDDRSVAEAVGVDLATDGDDRSVAKALGVDLATDGDLVWIGTRALQSKPPYPHPKTAALYRALAVLATEPTWAADAAGAPALMPHGWYRAVAVADFAPEQPTELAVTEGDVLHVSAYAAAPPGWLLAAYASDPSAEGLVPETHLVADDIAVTAECDFQPVSVGDLPFRAGETLLLRPGTGVSEAYWLARAGDRRGYVPRYVLDGSWRPRGELAVALIWAKFRSYRARRGWAETGARAAAARDAAPSIIHRKAACELGLSLATYPDLLWIVRRALARKPPLPDRATRDIYRRLVLSATQPAWPASPSGAGKLLPKGRYMASVLAQFVASDALEMSVMEGERLVLRTDVPAPDGWVLASRAAHDTELGLVPRDFVRTDEVRSLLLLAPACHGDVLFVWARPFPLKSGTFPLRHAPSPILVSSSHRHPVPSPPGLRTLIGEGYIGGRGLPLPGGREEGGRVPAPQQCSSKKPTLPTPRPAIAMARLPLSGPHQPLLPFSHAPRKHITLPPPPSPLAPFSQVTLVASVDHAAIDEGDLSFRKGDVLTLRPVAVEHSRAHWLAQAAGCRGFVPRYLLDPTWRAQGRLAVGIIWAHYLAHRIRGRDSDLPAQARVLSQMGHLTAGETRPPHVGAALDAIPAAVAEYAKMLGIDLIADKDLLWIARKALQAAFSAGGRPSGPEKPALAPDGKPDERTVHKYRALVALATDPSWRRDPAASGQLMRHGWYRATVIAAFQAQEATELAVEEGEAILVSGDQQAAQGWVMATRAANPGMLGLVPQSFALPDEVQVVASCDFEAVATGDLSFCRGDVLLLRPGALPSQAYWLASLHGRRGYVPRYLLDPSWRARGRLALRVIWSHFLAFRRISRATETPALAAMGRPSALPVIEQRCAAAIGIDLRVDPDLLFLARAALACKPAWPAAATATRYAALAARIGGTLWAETADPSENADVMSDGWYRAYAMASFEAYAEGELSLVDGEGVLVDGDTPAPAGWVLAARAADPSDAGLVPAGFLAVEDAAVTAPCNFEGTGAPGDLPFRRGDRLAVRPAALPARGFWVAKLGGRRGYVPRYLLDSSWVPRGRYAAGLICRAWRAHAGNAARRRAGLAAPPEHEPLPSQAHVPPPPSPLEALSFLVAVGSSTPIHRGSSTAHAAVAPADGPTAAALAPAGREEPPGYVRAWVVADFDSEHPLEMAVRAGETLLVDLQLPMPDGWVSAVRPGEWDTPGMVPITYLEMEEASTAGGAVGAISAECASSLGIDLETNPDLDWVVHRALSAKPAWPAPQTTVTYAALAAAALSPGWPSTARPASPPEEEGTYFATAEADFVSEDPMELAFGAGEVLRASGDVRAPAGWVLAARERTPGAVGLAPRAYLRPHFATVTAPSDFGGVDVGDVAFAQGDVLHVQPGALAARAYWLGSNRGRRGYVARYLIDPAANSIARLAVSCILAHWRRSRASAPGPLTTTPAMVGAPATAAEKEDDLLQLRRREVELSLREARVAVREMQQDLREKESELEAREAAIAARESAVSSASAGLLGASTRSLDAPLDQKGPQPAPPSPASPPVASLERDPDPDPLHPPPIITDDGVLLLHRRAPTVPLLGASSAGHRRAPDPSDAERERRSAGRRATIRAAAEELMRQAWQAADDQSARPSEYLAEALAHLQAALDRLGLPHDEAEALACLDRAREAMAYEAAHRLASSGLPSPQPLPPPTPPLALIPQHNVPIASTRPPMDAHPALPPVAPPSAAAWSHDVHSPYAAVASAVPSPGHARTSASWPQLASPALSPALSHPASFAASAAESAAAWQNESFVQLRASVDQLTIAARALHSTTTLHALLPSPTLHSLARLAHPARTPKRRNASRPKSRPASRPRPRPAAGRSGSARSIRAEPHTLPSRAGRADRSDSAPSRHAKLVSRARPKQRAAPKLPPPAADAWPDTKWSKTVLAYLPVAPDAPEATEWRVREPRQQVARSPATAGWSPTDDVTQRPLNKLSGFPLARMAADWFQPPFIAAPTAETGGL